MVPRPISFFFFFNDTATTEIYTLSLHDALPIFKWIRRIEIADRPFMTREETSKYTDPLVDRSEEHTSELQSQSNLVCRLLLEKKKNKKTSHSTTLDHDTGRTVHGEAYQVDRGAP